MKIKSFDIIELIAWTLGLFVFSNICHATDKRIKIGIIDTGLDTERYQQWICKDPESKDFTKNKINDHHGHGTNIFYLITKDLSPKKYCVVVMKFRNEVGRFRLFNFKFFHYQKLDDEYFNAISYATNIKLDYLNLSLGGYGEVEAENLAIKKLLSKGTKVVVAAGNNRTDLGKNCNYYPACGGHKEQNFYVVASKEDSGKVAWSSNYNGPVDVYEFGVNQGYEGNIMSGTSQATANYVNRLIRMENK